MTPDNARFLVADTETTGKDDHNKVCEVAWVEVDKDFNIVEQVSSLIDPEQLIPAAASGIHGLTNDMVDGSPTIEEFFSLDHPACYGKLVDGPVVLVGHRIGFDTKRLAPYMPNIVGEIDTLRWARRLYPDSDNHQLSTLVYALGLPISEGAHRAMADVMTAYHLARHICDRTGMNLQQLTDASVEPFLIKIMPFGKYKDQPIELVRDKGYFRWALANMDLDPDLRFSLETALNKKKNNEQSNAGADA